MSQQNSPQPRGDDPDLDELLGSFIFPIWLERVYEELPRMFGEFRAAIPPQQRAAFSRFVARGPAFLHDFLMRGSIHARGWQPLNEPPLQLHRPSSNASTPASIPDSQHLLPSTSQQTQDSVPQADELPDPSNRPYTTAPSRPSSSLSESGRPNRRQTPRPGSRNQQSGESSLNRYSSSKKASVPTVPPNASHHLAAQVVSNQLSQAIAPSSGLPTVPFGVIAASGGSSAQSLSPEQNQAVAPPPYSELPSGPQNCARRSSRQIRSNIQAGSNKAVADNAFWQAEIARRAAQPNLNTIQPQNAGSSLRRLPAVNNTSPGGMTAVAPASAARVPSTPAQALMTVPAAAAPVLMSANADTASPALLGVPRATNSTPLSEAPAFPGLMIPTPNAAPQNAVPQNGAPFQNGAFLQNGNLLQNGSFLQNAALLQNRALLQNAAFLQNGLPQNVAPAQNMYYSMIQQQNGGMQAVHPQVTARLQQMQRGDSRSHQVMRATMTPRPRSALAGLVATGSGTPDPESTSRKRRRSENGDSQEDAEQGDENSSTKRMKQSQMGTATSTGTGSNPSSAVPQTLGPQLNGAVLQQAMNQLMSIDSNHGTPMMDLLESAPSDSEQDQPEQQQQQLPGQS